MSRHRRTAGLTALELLLVVVIVALLAAMVLPNAQEACYDQLRTTAQIVAADLAYARSLAVANNDNYRITFDLNGNTYTLTHSGTNAALNTLPFSPFSPGPLATQHVVGLNDLPHVGPVVRLSAVATTGSGMQAVGNIEFGPLGQTTCTAPTMVWLMAGNGTERRYITLQTNPVTGLIQVNGYSSVGPPQGITQVQ